MGKIKKLKDVELVGGTEQNDVYPVTSTKAIYDENNERLDNILRGLLDEINNCAPIVINGNVTNAPDEEDLTSVNVGGTDVLKFKDKTYNPLIYSGMGRIILRKNIVSGVNTLTQSMINKSNTIYVIQYDFTLGEDITVPEDCVFEFNGGSISAGSSENMDTIIGNNTAINAGLIKIFNTNVTLTGTWNVTEAYPEWFGAKGDGVTDDALPIRCCLNSSIVCTKLQDKSYYLKSYEEIIWDVNDINITACIIVPTDKIIVGAGTSDYMGNSTLVVSELVDVGIYINGRNINFENFAIVGTSIDNSYSCNRLICSKKGVAKLLFKYIHAKYCNNNCYDIDAYMSTFIECAASTCNGWSYYFHAKSGSNTSINLINCSSSNSKGGGFLLQNLDYCNLSCCSSDACGYDPNNIDLNNLGYPYDIRGCRGITLNGCGCEANLTILSAGQDSKGITISGCYFLLKNKNEYPSGFDFSKVFNLDWITSTTVFDSLIGRDFGKLISATKNTNIVFNNCFIYNANNTDDAEKGSLNQNVVEYSSDAYPHGVVFLNKNINTYSTPSGGNNVTFEPILQHINESFIREVSIIKLGHGYLGGKIFSNIHGSIIFENNVDGWERCVYYCSSKAIIKNCSELIFKDINFEVSSFDSSDCVFEINNSKIKFVNCQFTAMPSAVPEWKIINNSHVSFINCIFLDYTGCIDDKMDIDLSSSFDVEPSIGSDSDTNMVRKKGKLFFTTSSNELILYNGTAWVTIGPVQTPQI